MTRRNNRCGYGEFLKLLECDVKEAAETMQLRQTAAWHQLEEIAPSTAGYRHHAWLGVTEVEFRFVLIKVHVPWYLLLWRWILRFIAGRAAPATTYALSRASGDDLPPIQSLLERRHPPRVAVTAIVAQVAADVWSLRSTPQADAPSLAGCLLI